MAGEEGAASGTMPVSPLVFRSLFAVWLRAPCILCVCGGRMLRTDGWCKCLPLSLSLLRPPSPVPKSLLYLHVWHSLVSTLVTACITHLCDTAWLAHSYSLYHTPVWHSLVSTLVTACITHLCDTAWLAHGYSLYHTPVWHSLVNTLLQPVSQARDTAWLAYGYSLYHRPVWHSLVSTWLQPVSHTCVTQLG